MLTEGRALPKRRARAYTPQSGTYGGAFRFGRSLRRCGRRYSAPIDASVADCHWFEDAGEISDGGERVSHLAKDHVYYGHLSIYDFATAFCRDAVVLDAGCGAGYGAARLADAGARLVHGIDVSSKAIAFSRHHFRRPNLEFAVADLQQLSFPSGFFDFIYSSNTLEHVSDVPGFLRSAHATLKATGSLLVAVPPITDDRLTYLNLVNPYHVNIWSPRQWEFTLGQFFGEVDVYLHGIGGIGPESREEGSPTSERDFVVARGSVGEMYKMFTLTAIFVASSPRDVSALPPAGSPVEFIDESFTRPPGRIDPEVRKRLRPYFDPPRRSPRALTARAWSIWRAEGTRTLARQVSAVLARRP
jgi:SAM-dependent methyltransferase